MRRKISVLLAVGCAAALALSGCGLAEEEAGFSFHFGHSGGNFRYESVVEQDFRSAAAEPSSYFSLDRNTAGYAQVRAQLRSGMEIAYDSVRTEELVNYFSYGFPAPAAGEGVRATAYLGECPWQSSHRLITVGLRTEERRLEAARNNYVFLVDVSGSMENTVAGEDTTCLGLVKYGLETLVGGLGEQDAVSIVAYASNTGVRLEPTLADEEGKRKILKAVDRLAAEGTTNGEAGIRLAYECAAAYFSEEGNNRVILMTDGDFNVGMGDPQSLGELVSREAARGVYLSVIGVGMGNMRDDVMQTLALRGNGNYAYVDTRMEAEKALGEELGGMLVTVARDCKAGVTFNPSAVIRYRLLGYDMKVMSEQDFDDSEKDAGEIGSNLTVVALYEAELREGAEEVADVTVRFISADGEAREVSAEVSPSLSENDDTRFIACVEEFGLVLRRSAYRGDAALAHVLSRLGALKDYLAADPYKAEFESLVKIAAASGYYGL